MNCVALADITQDARSGFASGESVVDGLVQVRMNNITTDGALIWGKVRRVPASKKIRELLVKPGDILFNATNSPELVGKCALFDGYSEPVTFSNHFIRLRIDEDRAAPRYVIRYLQDRWSRRVFENMCKRWVNQASVGKEDLLSLKLPLPLLEEQKRIAAILDQADSLRRLRQRAIDRLNTLGQAIFYEMFVGGGQLWPQEELSELGQVVTGATPPTTRDDYFVGNVPFITPGDLESLERVKRSLSEEGALKSRTINAGSALVCCIGATIGKIDQARERSAFNQQINAVQWKESVNANFGLYALRQIRATIIHKGKGASTTLPILKKSEFQKLRISVPPMRLQNSFSRRLEECRKTTLALETSLRKNRALFSSLQHRAFRGEL